MDRKPRVVGVPADTQEQRSRERAVPPSQPAREADVETPSREQGHEDAGHTEGIGYTESGKEWDRIERVQE